MFIRLALIILFLTSCAHMPQSGRYEKRGEEWVFVKTNVGFSQFFNAPSVDDEPHDFRDNGRFLWPVPSSKRISSFFGKRGSRHHDGIDIPGKTGSNIIAADSGQVAFSGWMRGYGKIVVLKHSGNYHTVYGHNDKLIVSKGDKVSRGQVIAHLGNTGRSSGPHLHFEIRKNNKVRDPANYMDWVKQKQLARK